MSDIAPIGHNGGAAFPSSDYGEFGMSLRDWFAGQALTAMLTHEIAAGADKEGVAEQAYHYADAMIAARGKPND